MVRKLTRHIERLVTDQSGHAGTEYAVLLALIVLMALGALTALSAKVSAIFVAVADIG